MAFRIIRCTNRHFDRMIDFVSLYNPMAEHHVGYFGLTAEDIRHSILMLNLRYDRGFRLAQVGQKLVGVMGVDFDRHIGRAWLYGPIVTAGDWMGTAEALYETVIKGIPAGSGVCEAEMFIDSHNLNCRRLAERHAFNRVGEFSICTISAERMASLPNEPIEAWDGSGAEQLGALHKSLFPQPHHTLDSIMEERDKGAILLVESDEKGPAGYFFGSAAAEAGEGYVELIGVRADCRRSGLGRRLMLAGLAQLRRTPGLQRVTLSVAADNEGALRLYDGLGFLVRQNMMAFRKPLFVE